MTSQRSQDANAGFSSVPPRVEASTTSVIRTSDCRSGRKEGPAFGAYTPELVLQLPIKINGDMNA